MYTQCPNCQEAFRVTAEILQRAAGRVRCGSCAHLFDALDGLSESPPRTGGAARGAGRSFRNAPEAPGDAGNVRLEDTGVEWRVEGRAQQEPPELETPTVPEERYDDHTPLPGLLEDDEADGPSIPEVPRRRVEDFIEPRSPELDERQADLVLGDPEDWTDLLEEVGDGEDAELGSAPTRDADDERGQDAPSDGEAPEADDDPTAEHPAFDAGELKLVDDDTAAADAGTTHRGRPHDETLEVTAPEGSGEAPLEQPAALQDSRIHSWDELRGGEESRRPAHYSGIAAAALLGLLLAAQLVHAYRETLVTYDVFKDALGAVYRELGVPITPDWDVNAWRFETTNGSTNASDSALTISSRIANPSQRALPYPLLHVTLTDRYEEVVGSELLEPAQYLEIRSARGTVDPGENFTATFTIAPLSADATGFKLNVCYPIEDASVRCATGAFKRE